MPFFARTKLRSSLIVPVFVLIELMTSASSATSVESPLYKDSQKPIEARVEDLLSRMTLEEKVAQMCAIWDTKIKLIDANRNLDLTKAEEFLPNGIGQVTRPSDLREPDQSVFVPGRSPRDTANLVNAYQHFAIEHTRLGIPIMFHEEGLHGYEAEEATSFPQAIGLASSFDPELMRRVTAIIAREIRVRGVQQVLSPVVDVARDPRWGRIEETFGEDPYLAGEMGVAAVRGLQGDTLPLADGKVFATLKHMTGHGQPEGGENVGPADISERTIREMFLPPFEQIVRRTNIRAIMASYNEIDGIPSHANTWLLGDILRGEWKYPGVVVSDYSGIDQLRDIHHVEPDLSSAAIRALKAGVDIDLPEGLSYQTLTESVRQGRVSEALIDQAVRRLLTLKFETGLFEHPYADPDAAEAITGNVEARQVALEAARRSIVLLKNSGVLPLKTSDIKTLAVIGPNAAQAHLGGYTDRPKQAISLLDGLRARVGKTVKIVSAEGVRLTESSDWWADKVSLPGPAENMRRIRQAVEVAKRADHIILVLGDNEQTSREGWSPTHLGDRNSLDLFGQQQALADAIFALHKPTVVFLINGRPLSVVKVTKQADALVEGWYLGQEGGTAAAEILFGDANPGGKLPVTFARTVGQLPVFYNYKPSAHRGYLFGTNEPLFPFGFGLSYTSFQIGEPHLSASTIRPDGSIDVTVEVKNAGKRAGDEVVQLYLHQLVSSVERPLKELKGFQRVTLAPGETRTVTLKVTPEALQIYDAHMVRVVEPGAYEIMVGGNSVDLKTTTLMVKD